MPEMKEY